MDSHWLWTICNINKRNEEEMTRLENERASKMKLNMDLTNKLQTLQQNYSVNCEKVKTAEGKLAAVHEHESNALEKNLKIISELNLHKNEMIKKCHDQDITLKTMREELKELIREESQERDYLNKLMEGNNELIKELEEKRAAHKKEQMEAENEFKKKQLHCEELKKMSETIKANLSTVIEDHNNKKDSLNKQIERATADLDGIKKENDALEKQIEEKKLKLDEKKKSLKDLYDKQKNLNDKKLDLEKEYMEKIDHENRLQEEKCKIADEMEEEYNKKRTLLNNTLSKEMAKCDVMKTEINKMREISIEIENVQQKCKDLLGVCQQLKREKDIMEKANKPVKAPVETSPHTVTSSSRERKSLREMPSTSKKNLATMFSKEDNDIMNSGTSTDSDYYNFDPFEIQKKLANIAQESNVKGKK